MPFRRAHLFKNRLHGAQFHVGNIGSQYLIGFNPLALSASGGIKRLLPPPCVIILAEAGFQSFQTAPSINGGHADIAFAVCDHQTLTMALRATSGALRQTGNVAPARSFFQTVTHFLAQ